MKLLRLPTKNGRDWWVVTHDFLFKQPCFKNVRPIHVLTFLAQVLVDKNKHTVFRLCLALENKMFAVKHNLSRLRSSIAKVGDPIYDGKFERDYDSTQEVIADLEAYLNSIYSVLEVTALLNRNFDRSLPSNFRRQAKKYKLFSFKRKKWLKIIYDIRSELTHYNTTLPILREGAIIIDFQIPSKLEFFKKGKYRITFAEIFNLYCELIKLLDKWAIDKLKGIDRKSEQDVFELDESKKRLVRKKVKVKNIIKMMRSCNLNKGSFGIK